MKVPILYMNVPNKMYPIKNFINTLSCNFNFTSCNFKHSGLIYKSYYGDAINYKASLTFSSKYSFKKTM